MCGPGRAHLSRRGGRARSAAVHRCTWSRAHVAMCTSAPESCPTTGTSLTRAVPTRRHPRVPCPTRLRRRSFGRRARPSATPHARPSAGSWCTSTRCSATGCGASRRMPYETMSASPPARSSAWPSMSCVPAALGGRGWQIVSPRAETNPPATNHDRRERAWACSGAGSMIWSVATVCSCTGWDVMTRSH
jgi:hypothetical protein